MRITLKSGSLPGLLVVLLLGWLSGCTSTQYLASGASVLQKNLDQPYSTVYILREELNLYVGPAQGLVTVEINGNDVVKLASGHYVMLRVKPGESLVVIKSLSKVGNDPEPREMLGTALFNFSAGQTNFLRLKIFNEEFRGVYYQPERIEFNRARGLVRALKPVKVPQQAQIDRL